MEQGAGEGEEEEDWDKRATHLAHLPLFVKGCKPERQAADTQLISSLS